MSLFAVTLNLSKWKIIHMDYKWIMFLFMTDVMNLVLLALMVASVNQLANVKTEDHAIQYQENVTAQKDGRWVLRYSIFSYGFKNCLQKFCLRVSLFLQWLFVDSIIHFSICSKYFSILHKKKGFIYLNCFGVFKLYNNATYISTTKAYAYFSSHEISNLDLNPRLTCFLYWSLIHPTTYTWILQRKSICIWLTKSLTDE